MPFVPQSIQGGGGGGVTNFFSYFPKNFIGIYFINYYSFCKIWKKIENENVVWFMKQSEINKMLKFIVIYSE